MGWVASDPIVFCVQMIDTKIPFYIQLVEEICRACEWVYYIPHFYLEINNDGFCSIEHRNMFL